LSKIDKFIITSYRETKSKQQDYIFIVKAVSQTFPNKVLQVPYLILNFDKVYFLNLYLVSSIATSGIKKKKIQ